MEYSKKQQKARTIIIKLREKGVAWRDIGEMTGVSFGYLSGIKEGYRSFSDKIADRIIASAKVAK
jgi:cyanate lyase